MSTSRPYIPPMTMEPASGVPFLQQVLRVISALLMRANAVTEVTLTAGATTTTLYHAALGYYSSVMLMPMTANAAGALATTYIAQSTMLNGSCVITHANAATTDRTFRVKIDG